MSERWPRLAAAVAGFLWYLQMGGWHTLNPSNTAWVLFGDWRQHYLGWLFFRDAPWTFPLGVIPNLPYPVGTTIGFTDSNPLVAILLKPFSSWLPAEAQFVGPFLALCFTLQGYFGAALVSVVTKDRLQQLLGGFVFVLTPVLVVRVGHDTLCAHWILLALLYFILCDYQSPQASSRRVSGTIAIVAIAAGTHPYLAAMSLVLAFALSLRMWMDRLWSSVRALACATLSTGAVFLMFYAIGYLNGASGRSSGFGDYSADLLTLINPDVTSRWLEPLRLPTQSGQWEGIAYLGLGGLLAAVCAVVAVIRLRPSVPRRVWIAGAACTLLGIYALSQHVRLAGTQVLDLTWLYAPFASLVSTFRSSGRFIWPVHYLALLFGIWGACRLGERARRLGAAGALAAMVLIQVVDVRFDRRYLEPKSERQAPAADFDIAQGKFRHLALAPMQVLNVCGDPYEEDHVYRFMLLAYRLKLTFNSGIYARVDAAPIDAACIDLERRINEGRLDPETIYVVSKSSVDRFKAIHAVCGRSDGQWICVSKDSDERFRRYWETGVK